MMIKIRLIARVETYDWIELMSKSSLIGVIDFESEFWIFVTETDFGTGKKLIGLSMCLYGFE